MEGAVGVILIGPLQLTTVPLTTLSENDGDIHIFLTEVCNNAHLKNTLVMPRLKIALTLLFTKFLNYVLPTFLSNIILV